MINEFNRIATVTEKGFNIVGSAPVLGLYSGTLRVICGKVQFISGCIFVSIATMGMWLKPSDLKWERMARASFENVIHGALNVIRGFGEALASASIFGFAIPLVVNLLNKPLFDPYVGYGFMQKPLPVVSVPEKFDLEISKIQT